jgi:hypothetical protein
MGGTHHTPNPFYSLSINPTPLTSFLSASIPLTPIPSTFGGEMILSLTPTPYD